ARTPYGVDLEFWTPAAASEPCGPLRFIYAGQVSVRKGVPLLTEAWEKAALKDSELVLVGSWQLAETKWRSLPSRVKWLPPCPPYALRELYRYSDVIVFPTFSDGFGLVLLEGMACGLPAIASEASGGPEVITPDCGRILPNGELNCLVELLRWFDRHRHEIPEMSRDGGALDMGEISQPSDPSGRKSGVILERKASPWNSVFLSPAPASARLQFTQCFGAASQLMIEPS